MVNLLALSLAILSLSFVNISPPSSESGWWCGVPRESCAGSLWGGEKSGGCFGEVVGAGGEG